VDGYATTELKKKDGRGGKENIAASAQRLGGPDMKDNLKPVTNTPPEQQAIRAKCFHPTGTFIEFKKEEIEQSIPERFEKIVCKCPDRTAVKTLHHEITYADLNRDANRIAHALLSRAGSIEEPIAFLLDTGAPPISAMLGVLKAGRIYVPLDPSLPRARLAYILADSQAALLITNTRNLSLAREVTRDGLPSINLDELDPTLSAGNPRISISPDTLTWVLYTSGSTGQPKGVVQNHRNVLHFVRTYTNNLHICPDDRLTLLFSCSANGAAHDAFSALLNGASIHPFNVKEKGPRTMGNWLIRNHLTIYSSVPTVFRNFVETLTGEESFRNLRLLKLIGEPVSRRDVELYQRRFASDCVFINRLGSTETGTIRWYFINKETQIDGNIVPVGYPVDENGILLLDDNGKEVEGEATGEIAVKSRYLTPGYWRRPDLTDAFLLPAEGDERIYRTGDIGHMLLDASLLCLGRKDAQVKIRGHRVELAEVEMALLNLGVVKAAVVIAREDRSGDHRLVAYLVAQKHPAPTATKLRRALAETLPEHMIPANFVLLDDFPLAPNGKIDRRALPDPGKCRPELDEPYVAPATPIEEELAQIWEDVLSLEKVGIHDNFFDLGRHSLLATQVMSRLREGLGVELPLRALFEAPTIAELALRVGRGEGGGEEFEELARHVAEVESLSEEEIACQLVEDNG